VSRPPRSPAAPSEPSLFDPHGSDAPAGPPGTGNNSPAPHPAPAPPPRRAGGRAAVEPAAYDDEIERLGRRLPAGVFVGTSSWSFPGWRGIVYGGDYSESQLARDGLAAYARHPVLRTVGIDRGFYQPLPESAFARYAAQVPAHFRFVVKAPALVTDAVLRGERGSAERHNETFLDAALATEAFVLPTVDGLGAKAGPLVFQLSPMPLSLTRGAGAPAMIERIGEFLARLPRRVGELAPLYAVELRNRELLTPRFVRMLRDNGARLCLSIHDRMPPAARQAAALRAMDAGSDESDPWKLKGPLVVRWNLHAGHTYEQAKASYAPFDRIVASDPLTRGTLSHLIHVAMASGTAAYVTINNKAEGSGPLSCIGLVRAVLGA
jgi:uncharacterized protein YecE (DUF72 family)